jgi:translation initiation factor 1
MKPEKLSMDGGKDLGHNPFGALGGLSLPAAAQDAAAGATGGSGTRPGTGAAPSAADLGAKRSKNRGRVDLVREKAGRGGKTVTVACGFVGISLPEKEQLAKKMQKACGVGGTVKEGRIEIQGDKRDEMARILIEAGFRPVFAGG